MTYNAQTSDNSVLYKGLRLRDTKTMKIATITIARRRWQARFFSLREAGGYLLHDFPNFQRKSELDNTKKSCILNAAVKIHNLFIIATKYVVQNW